MANDPLSTDLKLQAFLGWIREICIDDSRTYYRRIQAIMRVVHHFEESTDPPEDLMPPDTFRGVKPVFHD